MAHTMPRQTCDTNDGSGEWAVGSANGHRDLLGGERLRNPPRPVEWRHVLRESRCVIANDPTAIIRSVIRRIDSAWHDGRALKGETYTESGHAVMVFNRAGGEWRVMWRAMVPASS